LHTSKSIHSKNMNSLLQNDTDQINHLLEKVKLQGIEYLQNLSNRPASTNNKVELIG
jgi:hypothetical protein